MRTYVPDRHNLMSAATSLMSKGLSVIPVHGGSSTGSAKIAAVRWNEYRKRFATAQELAYWFDDRQFAGIAVVCGRLSRLAVLDFDEHSAYELFAKQFPHLIDTYTITSARRKTPHLYWRIPYGISGQKINGGELRAEGQYVVTAPTAIGSAAYTVSNNVPIRETSLQELREALKALKTPKTTTYRQPQSKHTQDIATLYREAAPSIGRNNALYQASRQAQHNGWTLTQTLQTLAPIHIEQKPSWKHNAETASARRTEASRTIHSAFKQRKTSLPKDTEGVPNSVREKLIETQKTSITARLLEALRREGVETVTEARATEIAKTHKIGRNSVIQALSGKLATVDKERIFPIVIEINMVCRETNGVKTCGRPPRTYSVPNNEYLYNILQVPHSGSDNIPSEDLGSGKRFRMALHRGMIERRPNEYARNWLATRLGVSVRSVQRYNNELDVQVTPVYGYANVTWDSALPLSDERVPVTPGRWLEDAEGKRYPALRSLAHKLLKDKCAPRYVRQLPNHYQLLQHSNEPRAVLWRCLKCHTRSDEPSAVCACHTHIPQRMGQTDAKIDLRECIHCGQLCFDGKLVCVNCRRKREQPTPRITFDKDGKPRFPIRYERILLTPHDVRHLLPDDFQRSFEVEDPQHKAWLETPDGKRYPTIQGLAFRLIKKYGEVFLVKRDHTAAMFYTLGTFFLKRGSRKLGLRFLRRAGLT